MVPVAITTAPIITPTAVRSFHSSNSESARRDFLLFKIGFVPVTGIIAQPTFGFSEDVTILFIVLKILTQVLIKTRGAIFTTGSIIEWTLCNSFIVETSH
jgi:hypothetical protein